MGYMSLVSHFNNSIVDYVYNPILGSWNQSRALIGIFKASVKFWGNSEGGNSGERLVWSLARLSDFYSAPYLKKVKSRESQEIISKAYETARGKSRESQDIISKLYENARKIWENSGETQKILMKATKVHKKSCERN